MKNKLTESGWKAPLLVFALVTIFFSCKKVIDVGPPPPDNGPREEIDGSMTARINGKAYVATATTAMMTFQGISISGVDSSGLRLTFLIKGVTPGTYELNGAMASAMISKLGTENYETGGMVSSGQIRILKIDTLKEIIAGTFSFNATRDSDGDTKTVTEGEFEMNYTPPADPTDIPDTTGGGIASGTFTAKADSVAFQANSVSYAIAIGKISFIAREGVNKSMVLTIDEDAAAGTYSLGSGSALASYSSSQISYVSDSGNVVITEHDTASDRIKGSFFFRGVNTANTSETTMVTEGFFDLSY